MRCLPFAVANLQTVNEFWLTSDDRVFCYFSLSGFVPCLLPQTQHLSDICFRPLFYEISNQQIVVGIPAGTVGFSLLVKVKTDSGTKLAPYSLCWGKPAWA